MAAAMAALSDRPGARSPCAVRSRHWCTARSPSVTTRPSSKVRTGPARLGPSRRIDSPPQRAMASSRGGKGSAHRAGCNQLSRIVSTPEETPRRLAAAICCVRSGRSGPMVGCPGIVVRRNASSRGGGRGDPARDEAVHMACPLLVHSKGAGGIRSAVWRRPGGVGGTRCPVGWRNPAGRRFHDRDRTEHHR